VQRLEDPHGVRRLVLMDLFIQVPAPATARSSEATHTRVLPEYQLGLSPPSPRPAVPPSRAPQARKGSSTRLPLQSLPERSLAISCARIAHWARGRSSHSPPHFALGLLVLLDLARTGTRHSAATDLSARLPSPTSQPDRRRRRRRRRRRAAAALYPRLAIVLSSLPRPPRRLAVVITHIESCYIHGLLPFSYERAMTRQRQPHLRTSTCRLQEFGNRCDDHRPPIDGSLYYRSGTSCTVRSYILTSPMAALRLYNICTSLT
jgi:hypothetical protein